MDIESVQEIVEIYQDEPPAHLYRRGADGTWLFEAFDDLDAVIRLASVGLDVPLAEVYKGIDFDDPSDA